MTWELEKATQLVSVMQPTARKSTPAELGAVRGIQVVPLSVDRSSSATPPWTSVPTARHVWVPATQLTPRSVANVPQVCFVQDWPPSVVWSVIPGSGEKVVPSPPTATQLVTLAQLTPKSVSEVVEFC